MRRGRLTTEEQKLLSLIAECGYFPKRCLRYLPKSRQQKTRDYSTLKKEEFIKERTFYFATYDTKGKKTRKQVKCCYILPSKRKGIEKEYGCLPMRRNTGQVSSPESLVSRSEILAICSPYGYHTKDELYARSEVIEEGDERFTKSLGVVGDFIVYDIMRGAYVRTLWDEREERTIEYMAQHIKNYTAKRLCFIDTAAQLPYVIEKRAFHFGKKGGLSMTDTGTYKETVVLVKSPDAQNELACVLNGRNKMNAALGYSPLSATDHIHADGKFGKVYCLNFCYPDIAKLKLFMDELSGAGVPVRIDCFKSTGTVLREMYPEVNVIEHDPEEFIAPENESRENIEKETDVRKEINSTAAGDEILRNADLNQNRPRRLIWPAYNDAADDDAAGIDAQPEPDEMQPENNAVSSDDAVPPDGQPIKDEDIDKAYSAAGEYAERTNEPEQSDAPGHADKTISGNASSGGINSLLWD